MSTLVGIAIKEEKITSTDDKVIDYWLGAEFSDSRWERLTIGHALSKTTGLCRPDPQIVVYLLEGIYEKSIVDIMHEKLISKLGDYNWHWDRDKYRRYAVANKNAGEVWGIILATRADRRSYS